MHRIDTNSAQADKFGVGKNGFTEGNPQTGEAVTALSGAFFDAVQEEIAGVIEGAGLTLNKDSNYQLWAALHAVFAKLASPALTGTPTAPTPAQATNSTQIATTEFVAGAISKFSSGSFEKLLSTAGYQKLPSGFIVQWGTLSMSSTTQNEYTILPFTFPVTFPNALFALTSGLRTGLATNAYTSYSLELATKSGASWYYITGGSSMYPTINWIAIGY
ncbi:hypothetical protein PCO82_06820 [Pectobacteriaceae bacterium CE90]|nr:hypothetical protein PCO82_06820 [Pectobacteriaceae bacterium CE90]